jgi:hypothetical protein
MMTPQAVIEAYVSDVARRLPRARRNDVALELQALLQEELQGKAGDRGTAPDEAMALELVNAFGLPEDVADRYRPAGFVIIPANRAGQFVTIALVGVLLQWLVTLPAALLKEPGGELAALGAWWISQGLGALWWSGFMVLAAIIAGWMRHTWPPAQPKAWRPHSQDTGLINRPLWTLGGIAAAIGIAILVNASWIFGQLLSPPVAKVFTFNPDFLPVGGAMVVLLWSLSACTYAIVFFEGRWRELTRRIELALCVAWFAGLTWLSLGPTIYVSPVTDEATKGWLSLIALFVLIDLGVKTYRYMKRPRIADALAAIAKT